MIRVLALVGGLGGAVTLSQFPEYSQQYLQRLAGAVDELSAVVAAFDASAAGFDLTRVEALATGIGFGAGWLMVAGLLRGLIGLSRRRKAGHAETSLKPARNASSPRGLREPPPVTRAARDAVAGLEHPAE
ncbi:DUF2937 family protein [Aliiroseovarius sp.]|uniref:DUF2937 family protein n=1 Tax=Aliiroseovarius sp. TaxID=1872442 RepID=UPI00262F7AC8|nr:DUF2937 family protein [Aliiroseovarius sp.]